MKKYFLLSLLLLITICAYAAKPYCVFSGSTLTFYYDDLMSSRSGTKYDLVYKDGMPKWNAKAASVTKVVFDSSFADARPTDGSYWFYNMSKLTTFQDLSNLNTSEMTSMASMFYKCGALTSLDLSSFDTHNVENMACMFYDCSNLTQLQVGNFKTGNVIRMNGMFNGCTKLTTIDVSNWDVSHVGTMNTMFYDCSNLTTLDVSGWTTSELVNIGYMFYQCKKLQVIDVSNWDVSNVRPSSLSVLAMSK